MSPKIETLSIKRFRTLKELSLEGLGRVNLITGRNNTGKSSVLEALRILASDASIAVIHDILRFREENLGDTDDTSRTIEADRNFPWSSLFNGFPEFSPSLLPIEIIASGAKRVMNLTMEAEWFTEERDEQGMRRIVPLQQDFFSDDDLIPALVISAGEGRRVLPLDYFRRSSYRNRAFRPDSISESRMPCTFVSAYGGERTATLGTLWDNIALSDFETAVTEALRIIDSSIVAVSMVGGEGARSMRTAIVRSTRFSRPVPLRSFGDGLNRLFGIILTLVNTKGGLLLIDEFENGMHHSIQADAWRAIFKLSTELDIQVVATSHSWDAVKAFQTAASESPEDGTLVRLTKRNEEVIPTLFRESELAIATRDHIEVR